MARAIDTVVFDIGNVLLEWDPRHLYRKVFADAGDMERFLGSVCTSDWNRQQDAGRSWREAESELIARFPDQEPHIRAFRARWREMVPGAIDGTVRLKDELKAAGVPLYAITNFAADTFAEARARFAFLNDFRGIIVSGSERILKPDLAIYRLLASRYDLDLTRAVFIDDSAANCEGARKAGMAAIHFTAPGALHQELAALGLI